MPAVPSSATSASSPQPRRRGFLGFARSLLIAGLLIGATVTIIDELLAINSSAPGNSAVFVVAPEGGSMFDDGRPLRTMVVTTQASGQVEACFLVGWEIANDYERFRDSRFVDPYAYIYGGHVLSTNTTDVTDLPDVWGLGDASALARIQVSPDDSAWEPVEVPGSEFKMNFPIRTFVPPSAEVLADDADAPAQVWASSCARMIAQPSNYRGLARRSFQFAWGHLDNHEVNADSAGDVEMVFGEVASEPIIDVRPEAELLSAHLRSVTGPFDSSGEVLVDYENTAGQAWVDAARWASLSCFALLFGWAIVWAFKRNQSKSE